MAVGGSFCNCRSAVFVSQMRVTIALWQVQENVRPTSWTMLGWSEETTRSYLFPFERMQWTLKTLLSPSRTTACDSSSRRVEIDFDADLMIFRLISSCVLGAVFNAFEALGCSSWFYVGSWHCPWFFFDWEPLRPWSWKFKFVQNILKWETNAPRSKTALQVTSSSLTGRALSLFIEVRRLIVSMSLNPSKMYIPLWEKGDKRCGEAYQIWPSRHLSIPKNEKDHERRKVWRCWALMAQKSLEEPKSIRKEDL